MSSAPMSGARLKTNRRPRFCFCYWEYDGTLHKIHYDLYQRCREEADRKASPTACIIDSQSVKSAEKRGGLRRSERL
jgi:hypothetical protein